MIYLTRRETFNAAHRLFRPDWDDAKNQEYFGKCANPNWHGHNYTLLVTVKGKMDPQTGYLVTLKDLSRLIREKITDKVDHKNLNIDVDFMKGKIASTENLAIAVWEEIESDIRKMNAELHCVKIIETENNFVEYYGG